MVFELRESTNQSVRHANTMVSTTRKPEVNQAVCRLQHQKIVGRVQAGRAGLGWGRLHGSSPKHPRRRKKKMVVAEVTRLEEERYKIKAVSLGQQESWTTWKGVVNRNIYWSELWKIPHARLSFLI